MKVTVWNENLHKKKEPRVTELYKGGIHAYVADFLRCDDIEVRTATLDDEEMYGEPFDIPNPEEIIFMGWFNGGEVFRSGCTWTRGHGRIFYFQHGHETNAGFKNENVQKVIKNAVRWACPIRKNIEISCPQFEALEK